MLQPGALMFGPTEMFLTILELAHHVPQDGGVKTVLFKAMRIRQPGVQNCPVPKRGVSKSFLFG